MVALAVLLTLVVLVSLAASTAVLRNDLEQQYEQRALAVARSVAASPGLARTVTSTRPQRSGPVQRDAERVRRTTRALYVVVTDDRGIRYSHPTPSNIGRRVSTSPDRALEGRDVVTIERGTLGYSARGKVPLRDDQGRVVGEVSVGIATSELDAQTRKLVLLLALVALAPLAIGLIGAVTLGRRLRRTTLGLEPEEMADLLREHAAVLGGVRDGVVAVDHHGRVTVTNPGGDPAAGPAAVQRAARSGTPARRARSSTSSSRTHRRRACCASSAAGWCWPPGCSCSATTGTSVRC